MPFAKGRSGNPNGRPKGSSKPGQQSDYDRLTSRQREAMVLDAGLSPLQFLLSVMVDVEESKGMRVEAAKAALPYVHRKMPTMVEVGGQVGAALDHAAIQALPAHDRLILLGMLEKMGARVTQLIPGTLPIGMGSTAEGDDVEG